MISTWMERFWRWASPTQLVGAAILFCLPWTSLQCHYEMNDGLTYNVVGTQSGLQAALGNYTDRVDELETGLFGFQEGSNKSLATPPRPALYLAAYGAMIVLGVAAGILLKAGRLRPTIVAVCSIAAFFLLLAQAQIGLPIADLLPAENVRWQQYYEREDVYERRGAFALRGPPVLILGFTWWYYGAFILPGTAAVTAMLECLIRRPHTDNYMERSEPMAVSAQHTHGLSGGRPVVAGAWVDTLPGPT